MRYPALHDSGDKEATNVTETLYYIYLNYIPYCSKEGSSTKTNKADHEKNKNKLRHTPSRNP